MPLQSQIRVLIIDDLPINSEILKAQTCELNILLSFPIEFIVNIIFNLQTKSRIGTIIME